MPANRTPDPPPAQPDDKDWTWVLERPCPDCGADVGELSMDAVANLNQKCAADFAEILRRDSEWVHARPTPSTWSPLEYACHVRDVFTLFSQRLELMLNTDDPLFANWDPNVTALESNYHLTDPDQVAAEILEAGNDIAAKFAALEPDQWERPGRRSDGASFSVLTFARYEVHDPLHHLWDVTGESMAGTFS
ncbi:MAG: DinB family protein [Acidimicrobiales bacterium]|nr:DinB family protein [Acidimicrobiales bacterium]